MICAECNGALLARTFHPSETARGAWLCGRCHAKRAAGRFIDNPSFGTNTQSPEEWAEQMLAFAPAPLPTTEPRLRPCPWCGAAAAARGLANYNSCTNQSCMSCGPYDDPQGEEWNRIAAMPARIRQLEEELSRERQARREAEERARSRI